MLGEAGHSSGVVARGTELRRAGLEPISNAPRTVGTIGMDGSTKNRYTYCLEVDS